MKLMVIFLLVLILSGCGESITRVKTESVPEGDTNCPFGGQKSTPYVDSNNNGYLDSDEIRGKSEYTCNEDPSVHALEGE